MEMEEEKSEQVLLLLCLNVVLQYDNMDKPHTHTFLSNAINVFLTFVHDSDSIHF